MEQLNTMWTALIGAPAWFIIVIVLNLIGVWLRWVDWFRNKFIVLILIPPSIVLSLLLVPVTVFPPTQPHPHLLLGLVGFLLGAFAWGLQNTLIEWAIRYFEKKQINNQAP